MGVAIPSITTQQEKDGARAFYGPSVSNWPKVDWCSFANIRNQDETALSMWW